MRWPRGPRGAWRLLPRRSLLAALFLFSLSSSFLYFVYVAPGIGKRWAEARGAGWGARRLPVERLSNPGRAGGGRGIPGGSLPGEGRPGPGGSAVLSALGSVSSPPAGAGESPQPGEGGFPRGCMCVCVCGGGVPARVPRGEHARGCRSPLRGGGRGRCRPRSPRGFPGLAGPERCRCQSRAGRQRACCLPACRRVCLEEVECCPSVCGLNSLSGRNPTPFVKWEDEKCVF